MSAQQSSNEINGRGTQLQALPEPEPKQYAADRNGHRKPRANQRRRRAMPVMLLMGECHNRRQGDPQRGQQMYSFHRSITPIPADERLA
jgi:hypothetical protein